MDIGADWIRKIHVDENGWEDIGYHIVIRRDGTFENGRQIDVVGAHCKGHNRNSIGICLIGGMDKNGKPDSNFTLAQLTQLNQTVNYLKNYYQIKKISGHRDYSEKECPCLDVHELLKT